MCWRSVPAVPWDGGVKSTLTGTHVDKLPGGVGVYKILGKMGTQHRPILRTVAISGIPLEALDKIRCVRTELKALSVGSFQPADVLHVVE